MNGKIAAPRADAPKKGLWTRLFYGFGSVAFGVKDNGFNVLLLLFYNQVLGVPAKAVGFALMIALIADALVDPVIGRLSDNWRSKWGRRHPFMYAAALPVALSYLALWRPPGGLSQPELLTWLTVSAIIVRVFLSVYEIPSTALVADLTEDYDQRTSFLGFRYFFGWWGGLVMSIVAFSVFLRPTAAYPVGQLNPDGYLAYGVVSSVIMLAAILISAIGTHRHIPSFKPAPPKRPFDLGQSTREIVASLSNRPFLMMIGAGLFGACAIGLSQSMLIYFRTYFWELSGDQISILILGNFGSTLVALMLAPRLSTWLGKKRAAIWIGVGAIIAGPTIYVLRALDLLPPNGSNALLAVLFASSFVVTVLSITSGVFTAAMFADVVEDSELKTGRRTEGLFFSANSFILQCVSGVGLFATGLILDFVSFPAGAKPGQVPDSILFKLIGTELPIVAILQLTALAFLIAYPITRATHVANLRKLAEAQAADAAIKVAP